MMDFVDGYYYNSELIYDGEDRLQAQRKAFSTIIPLIINNELSERQSICFRYKYISGKSQSEIAEILHLSQPTVSRHISSAKDIINSSLKYCAVALKSGLDEYDKFNNFC